MPPSVPIIVAQALNITAGVAMCLPNVGRLINYCWVPRLDSCAMHIGQSLLQDCFWKKPQSLTEAVNNPRFVEIVRRHLQLNAVARGKPDKALSHFPRDVSEDMMLVRQLHPEHSSR
jgi:hypothetical protein